MKRSRRNSRRFLVGVSTFLSFEDSIFVTEIRSFPVREGYQYNPAVLRQLCCSYRYVTTAEYPSIPALCRYNAQVSFYVSLFMRFVIPSN